MEPSSARRRPSPLAALGPLVAAVLVGAGLGLGAFWFFGHVTGRPPGPANDPDAAAREVSPRTPRDAEEREAIDLFKAVKDGVVNVDTVMYVRRLDSRVESQAAGTGSGFVWDGEGRVVTNFHVVREAVANRLGLRVVLADRTAWDARVVGLAPDYDLAVLKINAPADKLKPVKLGSSKDLEVGQKVYALGNPFGLSLTLTKGIVSALEREIESPGDRTISGVIQTDAPINPGNSGGPLLDKDGRLIGVNTAIKSPSGGNVGIGFAIPADTVNQVVPELIRTGKVLKPDLGLRLVDQRRLRQAGFPTGVMVSTVVPDGPAAKAGLLGVRVDRQTGDVEPGDLILAIDGQDVKGPPDYARMIANRKVGDRVKLTVERAGERREVEATLGGV